MHTSHNDVASRVGAPPLPSRRRPAVIGYTAGVFDMFHAGHLHLLKQARMHCDYLVVAVSTDDLAEQVRGQRPVVPLVERMAIVQSMRFVEHVVPQANLDKVSAWQSFGFDVLFVGDNLEQSPQWIETTARMAELNVPVIFLPATYARTGDLLDRGLKDLVAE